MLSSRNYAEDSVEEESEAGQEESEEEDDEEEEEEDYEVAGLKCMSFTCKSGGGGGRGPVASSMSLSAVSWVAGTQVSSSKTEANGTISGTGAGT